jgi:hypothetical protein
MGDDIDASVVRMKALQGAVRVAFVGFFASHIPATLLIDLQAIAPSSLVPETLANFLQWYATTLNDPLMSQPKDVPWFQSLIFLEMCFQLPFFFWAVRTMSSTSFIGKCAESISPYKISTVYHFGQIHT